MEKEKISVVKYHNGLVDKVFKKEFDAMEYVAKFNYEKEFEVYKYYVNYEIN